MVFEVRGAFRTLTPRVTPVVSAMPAMDPNPKPDPEIKARSGADHAERRHAVAERLDAHHDPGDGGGQWEWCCGRAGDGPREGLRPARQAGGAARDAPALRARGRRITKPIVLTTPAR